jgi:hypothetical protein
MTLPTNARATATAMVRMGYSGRSTARFVGASETTIRRWIADDEYRKTAQPQEVIDMINSIADRIAALQDEVREALLQRMLTGAPQASVRECATAFAVLANRATPIVAPVVDAVVPISLTCPTTRWIVNFRPCKHRFGVASQSGTVRRKDARPGDDYLVCS